MPSIKIPDRYKPGIVVLANLPDEVFSKIEASLQTAPSKKEQKELTAWLSTEASNVTPVNLKRLIETVASLYRLKVKSGVSAEQLATAVADSASKDDEVKVPADIVRSRLASLLDIPSLELIDAKAKELQLESERTFCDARIVTDLRPVFGGNVSDSPEAMIIVHTLKLGYHDSRSQQHNEMFIGIDADDIATLIDILKRAQEKTKTLKRKLDSVSIRYIDFS